MQMNNQPHPAHRAGKPRLLEQKPSQISHTVYRFACGSK